MKLSAALANGAWLAASLPAWQRFSHALHQPAAAQAQILHQLLRKNEDSAYGHKHRFSEIRNYQAFRARVPIVAYEELEPWVARIRQGDSGVLAREPVTRLVPTSGSTAARKLIPFTSGLQVEFNAAIGPWMVDLCRQHPDLALGPAYWSISPALPAAENETSAVPIGFDDDSAYLGGLRQRLAKATFAVPAALRLVTDPEMHRYLTLLCLLRQPELRLISVWHPSFLTLLLDALPGWWAELLEDLQRGGCRRADDLNSTLPALTRVRDSQARPRLAARLRHAGLLDPHLLWPRLRVVSCWGDGQAALPFANLQKRLPHLSLQSKGLLATEAVVTIPFQGRHPLALRSHFYEFEDPTGDIHLAHELQKGQTYRVIVTTAGGLWRYRLGDEVEVDGWCARTPSLRFLGRGSSISDLCGEKLSESFVTLALRAAFQMTDFTPTFALLAPELEAGHSPHYTLFVEGALPSGLLEAMETELRQNPHYAHCRRLGQLGPLQGCCIEGDASACYYRTRTAEGRKLGDIKPQTLSTRLDWRDHFDDAGKATHFPPG